MAKGLTVRQTNFINEYLTCFNATMAADRAGYTGDSNVLGVTGYELLRNPKISEAISQRLRESAMSADEVLMRLAEQARGEHGRYITTGGTVDIATLVNDKKAHLIKKVKETKDGMEYEFYDAQSALNTLAKHHGLLTDKTEITGKDGEAIQVKFVDYRAGLNGTTET